MGLEPATFRSLVRLATSSATEPTERLVISGGPFRGPLYPLKPDVSRGPLGLSGGPGPPGPPHNSTTGYCAAWSTWVCRTDAQTGADLEAQCGRQFELEPSRSARQLRSVPLRRHTGRCLSRLPICTCSSHVRPHQTAVVSHCFCASLTSYKIVHWIVTIQQQQLGSGTVCHLI